MRPGSLDFRRLFPHILHMGFFFTLVCSLAGFSATIITQTVGQVSDHVVTSREVKIASVIDNVLFPLKADGGQIVEIQSDKTEYRRAVTNALLELVVSYEAENFSVAVIKEEELSEAIQKVEKGVVKSSYWSSLEVSPAELRKMILRKLTAKNFLKFKTHSLASILTDLEAQSYYDKNRAKFGNLPFESFKENIKSFLAQQQLEERIRNWFEVIKLKYKVRNFTEEQ